MKVKWLVSFNGHEPGHVANVPEEKGKFWVDRGMVEKVKAEKKDVAAPVKKVIENPEVKK